MFQVINTDAAPKAIGPYSQATRAGDWLFISGQISIDPKNAQVCLYDGDVAKQCDRVLENLSNILQAAEFKLDDVVKTTVFLRNMANFSAMNEVYTRYFGTMRPARATVAVSGLPAGVDVEIDAIAYRGEAS